MWTFLQPGFLWAGAAALAPLLLHLLRRRSRRTVRLSTLRFLKAAERRSRRRLRLEHLLLWLLRTLLTLVLTLAFAGPVLRAARWGRPLGRAPRDVAVVLDGSYSMSYDAGGGPVWERARAAARRIVQGLGAGDRACVYLAAEEPLALLERPTSDLAAAARAIEAARWQHTASRLDRALAAAEAALRESGNREREIYLLTDGQALPWQGLATAAEPGAAPRGGRAAACFILLAGAAAPENTAPCEAELVPAAPAAGRPGRLLARVRRSGPATETAVTLSVDGRDIARQSARLAADGRTTLEFALPPLAAGPHTASLRTPPDALAADDALHLVLRVRECLPVLCVGTESDAFFLTAALDPGGTGGSGVAARRIDPPDADREELRRYAAVFLVNALPLPAAVVARLEEYARGGGVLALFPGGRAAAGDYEAWSVLPVRPLEIAAPPAAERVRTLRLAAPRDPLFQGLALPPGAAPSLTVRRHLRTARLAADATALVTAGEDLPLLSARPAGRGRVFLFAVSADREWSALPLTALFLPLVQQLAQYGAALNRPPLWVEPASRLDVSAFEPETGGEAGLIAPGGRALNVRPVRREGVVRLEAEALEEPGVYRWRRADGEAGPALAVNAARAESDLTTLSEAELRRGLGRREVWIARDAAELSRLVELSRRGRPLAEPLLWCALALAAAEFVWANRLARRRAPARGAAPAAGKGGGP